MQIEIRTTFCRFIKKLGWKIHLIPGLTPWIMLLTLLWNLDLVKNIYTEGWSMSLFVILQTDLVTFSPCFDVAYSASKEGFHSCVSGCFFYLLSVISFPYLLIYRCRFWTKCLSSTIWVQLKSVKCWLLSCKSYATWMMPLL